jgi:PAS domain-containing protein
MVDVDVLALWCRAENGSTTYVNETFQQLFCVDEAQLKRDAAAWRAAIHPDDRARVDAAGDERDGLVYHVIDRSSRVREIRERVLPVFDNPVGTRGSASVFEDVLPQKERGRQLARALELEARTRTAAEVAHKLDDTLAAASWIVEQLGADHLPDPVAHRVEALERLLAEARDAVAKLR